MLIISNTLRYFSLRYVSYMTNLYTHHIKHTHVLFTPMRLILNEHIHISCQPPLGTFHSDMPYTSHTHSNYISNTHWCFSLRRDSYFPYPHYNLNTPAYHSHIAAWLHVRFVPHPVYRDPIPIIPLRLRPRRAAPAFFLHTYRSGRCKS